MAVINSYTNWGKLKEVWLGDVYPSHFYDHLKSEVRDVFYKLTESTKQVLAVIAYFAQFMQVWQHLRRRDLDFGY